MKMARAKQPVSIDGIEFDALLDQSMDYEADVPEYPTEKGFSVSDNISLKPETLSMTLYVSDTPVTWKSRFGSGKGRVEKVVKQLQDLYFAKKVVTVVTSDAVFDSMAITSISFSKSADVGYAREIPISLKKIIVTESSTTSIPDSYGKSGTTGASAGTANTTAGNSGSSGSGGNSSKNGNSDSGKNGSILYNAANSLGIIN
jgi:hypothetical protein